MLLKPEAFVPNEIMPKKRLYVIIQVQSHALRTPSHAFSYHHTHSHALSRLLQGSAMHRRHLLEVFEHWGIEDLVLNGDLMPRPNACAITYLHTLWLDTGGLEELREDHPVDCQRIKFYCLYQAMIFYLVSNKRKGKLRPLESGGSRWSKWGGGGPGGPGAGAGAGPGTVAGGAGANGGDDAGGSTGLAEEVRALHATVAALEGKLAASLEARAAGAAAAAAAKAAEEAIWGGLDALREEVRALALQRQPGFSSVVRSPGGSRTTRGGGGAAARVVPVARV